MVRRRTEATVQPDVWDGPTFGQLGSLDTNGDRAESHACAGWYNSWGPTRSRPTGSQHALTGSRSACARRQPWPVRRFAPSTAGCRDTWPDIVSRAGSSWSLDQLLAHLNPILRGWTSYFRFAASKRTFAYLDHYSWWRVARWLWKKHKQPSWKRLRRRELKDWEIRSQRGYALFRPSRVPVERYRYRGTRIPSPWEDSLPPPVDPRRRRTRLDRPSSEVMESRMRGNAHVRFGGRGKETD
jgi:hypothetical protein